MRERSKRKYRLLETMWHKRGKKDCKGSIQTTALKRSLELGAHFNIYKDGSVIFATRDNRPGVVITIGDLSINIVFFWFLFPPNIRKQDGLKIKAILPSKPPSLVYLITKHTVYLSKLST